MSELVIASEPLRQLPRGILLPMAASRSDESSAESSDEALAERVRADGDPEAFAALVTRYRSRLVALTRRLLARPVGTGDEDAADIAQEAFVAAYDKRAAYRRGEPYRPWLYRIAVNRCLDRLRAEARRPQRLAWEQIAEPESPEGDPLGALLADEREARLQAAVAALPPRYRAIFLLRHLDDLSYEEIARATDLPMGTVKTNLFRARALLRAALQGYLD